jgi:adenylate cyclase
MRRLPDRLLVSVVLSGTICALVAMLTNWVPYADLDYWTYDFLVNHGGYPQPSSDVVFVDFDDRTFEQVKQYPMPRSIIAQVIEQIGNAHPAVIGLDILLSEPRDQDDDRVMQDALIKANVVILAAQTSAGQIPGAMPMAQFCQAEDSTLPSGYCSDKEPGALGYASINMPEDDDGFIRDMWIEAYDEKTKKTRASFPVFLAEQYLAAVEPDCKNCTLKPLDAKHATFRGNRIPYDDLQMKSVRIGHWSPNPVKQISAWDVLSGQAPDSEFHNKLVLIGQGSDAARDQDFTPIWRVAQKDWRRHRMAGTALHAEAIQTLLDGTAIGSTATWLVWSINFVVVAGAVYLVVILSLRGGFISNILLLLAIYAVAQCLFTYLRIWFPYLTTTIATAAALPLGLAYQYFSERVLHSESEEQRTQLMGLFSKYVDPEVAQTIWMRRNELSLLGQEKVATVLFTDIRSFTAMSAGLPSQTVLKWLNEYFTAMDNIIRAHGGLLNKFIGDGLLVVYGVPLSRGLKEDTCEAVRTAFDMLRRLEEMNRERDKNSPFPEVHMGAGIHTGPLTCGSVGSATRLEYSVIGETVNLASRLESLNKDFHTEIIMSGHTYEIVKDVFPNLYPLGTTPVRGFDQPMLIYSADTQASSAEAKSLSNQEIRGATV